MCSSSFFLFFRRHWFSWDGDKQIAYHEKSKHLTLTNAPFFFLFFTNYAGLTICGTPDTYECTIFFLFFTNYAGLTNSYAGLTICGTPDTYECTIFFSCFLRIMLVSQFVAHLTLTNAPFIMLVSQFVAQVVPQGITLFLHVIIENKFSTTIIFIIWVTIYFCN